MIVTKVLPIEAV